MAVIDATAMRGRLQHSDPRAVVAFLKEHRPSTVAVDSPCTPADPGKLSRCGERKLAAAGVCGIRYTPDQEALDAFHPKRYYEWINRGRALYAALEEAAPQTGWNVIEVFPTASWSRWNGRRKKGVSRARWSSEALEAHALEDVPLIIGQDWRDALGAALTARLYPRGTEAFGEIIVPLAST